MPALPDVAGVLRLQLKHSLATDLDVIARTYWAYTGTAPTSTALSTMASTVATDWASALAPFAASDVSLTEVEITDLTSASAGRGIWTGTHTGTRSGSPNPGLLCALVNFEIARRYRGGKPRNYYPYGTSADINGADGWTSAFVSSLTGNLTTFYGDVIAAAPSGATITGQVNVSYYEGFVVSTNPLTGRARNVPKPRTTPLVDDVLSFVVSSNYSSQRRRQRVLG